MPFCEIQLYKRQDLARSGELDNGHFAFVADGHGTDQCIKLLRSIDPIMIASKPNPAEYVFELMQAIGDTTLSGTTFTFARIVPHNGKRKVQVWNVGDSETHVFVNGALVYKTPPHNFLNEAELERIKPFISYIDPVRAPFPVSSTRAELVLSPVGHFKTGESLALSMAYGHNNMTGFAPSYWENEYEETDVVRAVCGSDGFFDMLVTDLSKTAEELATEAADRWKQKWEFFDGKSTVVTAFGDYDDVAVAICP
jgi:serine/threonine protein phosphatase PrpC